MLLLVLLMNTGIWKMRHHLFEWIPYGDVNYTDTGSSSVIGPGTTDYEFGYVADRFGLSNDAIDHFCTLPSSRQHHKYCSPSP